MYQSLSTHDMHEKAPEVVVAESGLEVLPDPDPALALRSRMFEDRNIVPPEPSQTSSALPLRRPRKMLGMGPFASGLLVGIIIAIILDLAVGLGLGSALISCRRDVSNLRDQLASTPPSATSATTTGASSGSASQTSSGSSASSTPVDLADYAVADASTISRLHNDCSSATFTSVWGDDYSTDCNIDYVNGQSAKQGGIVADIAGILAYSFEDCLNACSALNNRAGQYGFPTTCRAISWSITMSKAISTNKGNCWLKNGTLANASDGYSNANVMSAMLKE